MTASGDRGRQEEVVERLRELRAAVADEDRPRAGLYLGLAIADLIPLLPDDDHRRPDLIEEGLACLDESADASPASTTARDLLAASRAASRGAESFRLTVGDIHWDLDWEALRGPTEAARQLTATLPTMAAMLPAGTPMRRALTDVADILGALDRGEWSAEHDATLASAIREVETGSLGTGLGVMLRMIALTIRVQRGRLAEQAGRQVDWPPLKDFDLLIADMESADELAESMSQPFQNIVGLHHLYIAGIIMMRLYVDSRNRDKPRDTAWRAITLHLLDRADDHLRQTPAAYGGPVQQMRANLAKATAELRRASPPPSEPAAAPRSPAPSPPGPETTQRPSEPEAAPVPVDSVLSGTVADSPAAPSWSLDGAFSQFASPEIMAGFKLLAEATGSPVMSSVTQLTSVLQSALARRWTPEADEGLAALRETANRLEEEPGASLSERALVAALLAMARSSQWNLQSADPQPGQRPSAAQAAETITEIEASLELLSAAAAQSPSASVFAELAGPLHAQAAMLLTDLGRADGEKPDHGLLARARDHMAQVPLEMLDQMPPVVGDVLLLQRLITDNRTPNSEEAERLATRFREVVETTGDLAAAQGAAERARQAGNPEDIALAIRELNKAGNALPAGSPQRSRVLNLLAEMQTLLTVHTNDPLALGDAMGSAVEALRSASESADAKTAVQRLIAVFGITLTTARYGGPVGEAEQLLREALASAGPGDWPLRVIAMAGIAAAMAVRAAELGDQALRADSMRLIVDAERLLPDATPTGDWYAAARNLYTWAVISTLHDGSAELAPVALRLGDQLEAVLVDQSQPSADQTGEAGGHAPARDQTTDSELSKLREGRARLLAAAEQAPGSERAQRAGPAPDGNEGQRLARRALARSAVALNGTGPDGLPQRLLSVVTRFDPAPLRAAMTDLHQALAGSGADLALRRQVDEALGLCAAGLYWADPTARTAETLREAVVHLNRALAVGQRQLPTIARADLLDVLARCQREVALHHTWEDPGQFKADARHSARAAVRELARCVLLTEDTGQALETAARANEIVARAVGWCLADGEDRAAVEFAEAGRGLVLAGVVLTGRVDEVLRGAGRPDVADAWQQGSAAGRAAALDALWDTRASSTLLAAPTVDEVSVMLAATRVDAVVYLVPPARDAEGPDGPALAEGAAGHAVLVRPLVGTLETLPLPGLAAPGSTPLDEYLAALDGAIASFDPGTAGTAGFRGGASGQAWADALERLGEWAYEHIAGPLIEHARSWKLNRLPHLVLIPLGDLAAVPYSASWTSSGAPAGGRRYAIDDVVITYATSARLLGDVARRPSQPLTERVVLVSDPTGEFPMGRRAARDLARRQYRGAEVYGPRNAPNGPATTDVLLGALPGRDRPGASLFQLSTHATTIPVPQLQTRDGWLPISQILDQARDRPPNAPGGLIITNACLTDSTRVNYDESLTLATAFLAAGATTVIGTRWPVDDDTATALSLRLHFHLQLGKLPAEALRSAQLDLARPTPEVRSSLGPVLATVEESRLSHPVTWAGHVHHGISTGLKENAAVPDAALPEDLPDDPLLRALATHWTDVQRVSDQEQQNRMRALAQEMNGPDAAEARAELADELLELLPPDHPVILVLRSGTQLARTGDVTDPVRFSTATETVPVTIYLSDGNLHAQVEGAVEELLATVGLVISARDEPIIGSWFRRMTASVRSAMGSPAARDALGAAGHLADNHLSLPQDATITATLMHNLGPVIQSLHPTKDAVIRVGALLIVKVDWTVNVIQLTAAQQFELDHHPQLASAPHEIVTLLNFAPPGNPGDEQARQLSSPRTPPSRTGQNHSQPGPQ